MTRIYLHIGLPGTGTERLQNVLDDKRGALAGHGVLLPRAAGRKNHTRLYMAVTDPDHIDTLRWHRGHATAFAQDRLREEVQTKLAGEIAAAQPDKLILSSWQLARLNRPSELARLHDLLRPISDEIRIVAHVDHPARLLVRNYAEQVIEGRISDLSTELALAGRGRWRDEVLSRKLKPNPALNGFEEIHGPPHWIDLPALMESWQAEFGPDTVTFRPYDPDLTYSREATREVEQSFELAVNLGKTAASTPDPAPSAAWLTRARALNELLVVALRAGRVIPRQLRRRLMAEMEIPGPAIDPGALSALSDRLAPGLEDLTNRFPDLATCLTAPDAAPDWTEADPQMGFRATQYLAAFLPRIDAATKEADEAGKPLSAPASKAQVKQKSAPNGILPPLAVKNFEKLNGGRFAPHNDLGRTPDEEAEPQFAPMEPRQLPKGSTGNVIVGCMKDEGPYIIEWVAYHRAIGVDNFLIYTNGCTDGTDEILDRLQAMGMLQHRLNDDWRGNSPQQFALNRAMKEEKLVQSAEWLIHIDVDEFINVRTGNGTLPDLFAAMPDATNIAMTWRLFGNSGIDQFEDRPVIEQFDQCAPKYCPKPHTVWGFKTMTRNIGAYDKLSCHRPNKLHEDMREQVNWANGSGKPMGDDVKTKGWRSDLKTVGYDLVQLNHYALRSGDSYLIKRKRGRALHVDRTIGLNYWIRMDWSDHRDVTIQRNTDRVRAEIARLKEDKELAALHDRSVEWHRNRARELRENREFAELYDQARTIHLTPMERVAYSLALDMES